MRGVCAHTTRTFEMTRASVAVLTWRTARRLAASVATAASVVPEDHAARTVRWRKAPHTRRTNAFTSHQPLRDVSASTRSALASVGSSASDMGALPSICIIELTGILASAAWHTSSERCSACIGEREGGEYVALAR